MNPVKAIETSYNGYRFRSRLEARWAVFFDRMGMPYEYEPEGFDLGGTYYLPDFRVTTPRGETIWYEVKPAGVTSDPKFEAFKSRVEYSEPHPGGRVFDTRVRLLSGDPMSYLYDSDRSEYRVCPACGFLGPMDCGVDMMAEGDECWFGCGPCDYGIGPGASGLHGIPVGFHKGWTTTDWQSYEALDLRVRRACEAARSARFEWGDQPQLRGTLKSNYN